MNAATGGKLIPVQALRGLAAASVLFGHVQVEVGHKGGTFVPVEAPWGIGVDVFFVISGLIMVISSQRMFGSANGAREFMLRRLIRIVPIYWFYTALAIVAVLVVPSGLETMRWDPVHALGSFFFFPMYRWDGEIRPLLGLGWTLNYEMFFYLLFALSIWLPRAAALATLLVALLGLVLLGAMVQSGPAPIVFWTRSIILEFGLGVALGWLWLRTAKWSSIWLLMSCLAAACAVHLAFGDQGWPRVLSRGVPAALVVAGFVWGFPDTVAARLKPIADWLGESSYSLYLSHPFSIGLIVMLWPFDMGRFDWLLIVVCVTGGVIAGVLSHRLIERPVHQWMQTLLRRNRSASAVTTEA